MKSKIEKMDSTTVPHILQGQRKSRHSVLARKLAVVLVCVLVLLCNISPLPYALVNPEAMVDVTTASGDNQESAPQESPESSMTSTYPKQAVATQTAAYESIKILEYIGECRITAYCCEPYAHICGTGDGLTATGIPVAPGIAAVDPSVIPLGSTLIIDGQQYLAADVGAIVKGLTVDIAVISHQEAIDFGVQSAPVWIVSEELPSET